MNDSAQKRIVLTLEYDGSQFVGWQWQTGLRSVQQTLEHALGQIANHPVTLHCAGRTDTGVHALAQVAHFDTSADRSLPAWLRGTNTHLPDDVRIIAAQYALDDFHARYSAIARFYRYVIVNRSAASALHTKQSTWYPYPLAIEPMQQAAQYLLGEQNFSAFRAQSCQSNSPYRRMYFITIERQGEQVMINLAANAFLHHMVRNIVGVLLLIGAGKRPPEWTLELLRGKNRRVAAATAPPNGLFLAGVYYPAHYGLTNHPIFKQLPSDAQRFCDFSG